MYDWLLNQVGMYLAPDDQGGDPAADDAGGTDNTKPDEGDAQLLEFLKKRNLDPAKDDPMKIIGVLWSESGKMKEQLVGKEKSERQKRQEAEGWRTKVDLEGLLKDDKVNPELKGQIMEIAGAANKVSSLLETLEVLTESGVIPSELLEVVKEGPAATRAAIAYTKRQEASKELSADQIVNDPALMGKFKELILGKAKVGEDLGQARPADQKPPKPNILEKYRSPESLVSKTIKMFKEGAKK